jgi:hypothetical protein
MPVTLEEGWYLMSVRDLEIELARARGEDRAERSGAIRLTVDQALDFRNAGNVPDGAGRSLRLVLEVGSNDDVARLDARRLEWEPDFHESPNWRRDGSVPVNIVPLRAARDHPAADRAWWDDPALAALEDEWTRTGAVRGISVPAEYRGFIYKTVLALESAGRAVTVDSLASSIERWLQPGEADALRAALEAANDLG